MKTANVKPVEQKVNELFAEFEQLSTDESGQLIGGVSTIDLEKSNDKDVLQENNYFQCGCRNHQCRIKSDADRY